MEVAIMVLYRQTERSFDLYKEVTQRLLDEGKAYRVLLHPEELLDAVRQEQMDRGETPKYNG